MDRALYIGMTGAKQAMRSQSVSSNNLANVNTPGFKKDFNDYIDSDIKGAGFKTRTNVIANGRRSDFTPGQMIQTGRDLDVAVKGKGFISIQKDDGTEAFTRAGSLRINENGLLINSQGFPVMGNDGGPIAIPPADKIQIGADGTISILPTGQDVTNLAVIDRIKLVNPDIKDLEKSQDGTFSQIDGTDNIPADVHVNVVSGFLESSNVNGVQEMVKMISSARLFEAQVKIMTTEKDNDTASSKLLRLT
jgi:flagellar basal-body rod protein FlgF